MMRGANEMDHRLIDPHVGRVSERIDGLLADAARDRLARSARAAANREGAVPVQGNVLPLSRSIRARLPGIRLRVSGDARRDGAVVDADCCTARAA